MHSFKKVILSIICVCLIFSGLSALIMEPYLLSETEFYQDRLLRDSLKGKIDVVSVGASNSMCAFVPQVADTALGCCSYNLSCSMMTLPASRFLLEKELKRNPIHTVFVDLSYETLRRNSEAEQAEGDIYTYARLSSAAERIKFLIRSVSLDDWPLIYSQHMVPRSIGFLLDHLVNRVPVSSRVDYAAKGFQGKQAVSQRILPEKADSIHHSKVLCTEPRPDNLKTMISLIELCHKYHTRVILVNYPRADSALWALDGQDEFYHWARTFAEEQGCEFYDTNLLIDRYALFDDDTSFYDGQHMSSQGAAALTEALMEITHRAETEDVSSYFYPSYEQMLADSPYVPE